MSKPKVVFSEISIEEHKIDFKEYGFKVGEKVYEVSVMLKLEDKTTFDTGSSNTFVDFFVSSRLFNKMPLSYYVKKALKNYNNEPEDDQPIYRKPDE